jgi:hypothetical protein
MPDGKTFGWTFRHICGTMEADQKQTGGVNMLHELGISKGTVIVLLVVLYFVVKWAVRNGIAEAYTVITGKKTADETEAEKMLGLEKTEDM